MLFIRKCKHPLPGFLATDCVGESIEYRPCNLGGCPGIMLPFFLNCRCHNSMNHINVIRYGMIVNQWTHHQRPNEVKKATTCMLLTEQPVKINKRCTAQQAIKRTEMSNVKQVKRDK